MALIWAEGFDIYGSDADRIAEGLWGHRSTVVYFDLSSSNPRHGSYSMEAEREATTFHGEWISRPLKSAVTSMGVGFGYKILDQLPATNLEPILSLRDMDNLDIVTICVNSTGSLSVVLGEFSSLGSVGVAVETSAFNSVRVGAWHHIEVQAVVSGAGRVDIRVDGVPVLSYSGDTTTGVLDRFANVAFRPGVGDVRYTTYESSFFDDIYIYDFSGSYNNTWMGDRFVRTLEPNADTATADWSGSYTDISGTFNDSTYISASDPGSPGELTSEFELENLPSSSGDIAAVITSIRSIRTSTGAADFQSGIVSGGSESRGEFRSSRVLHTYQQDIFETDPNSGVAFTPSDINSLKLQVNRL